MHYTFNLHGRSRRYKIDLKEEGFMNTVLQFMKYRLRKAAERDRRAERYIEAASRSLWRWRESRLLVLVAFVALLDYATTYTILAVSGKSYLNEAGSLARWALDKGGFAGQFLADLAAVFAISLAAITLRFVLIRFGFKGFGRAAFVFLLLPYAVVAMAAVINNLVLTYL
jgi:hypothetical protein